jgi:hypothetical protein
VADATGHAIWNLPAVDVARASDTWRAEDRSFGVPSHQARSAGGRQKGGKVKTRSTVGVVVLLLALAVTGVGTAVARTPAWATHKPPKPEQPSAEQPGGQVDGEQPDGEQPKAEDAGKPPKAEDPGKPPKAEDPGKPPKAERAGKPPKAEHPGKPPKAEHPGKPPKAERAGKPPKAEHPEAEKPGKRWNHEPKREKYKATPPKPETPKPGKRERDQPERAHPGAQSAQPNAAAPERQAERERTHSPRPRAGAPTVVAGGRKGSASGGGAARQRSIAAGAASPETPASTHVRSARDHAVATRAPRRPAGATSTHARRPAPEGVAPAAATPPDRQQRPLQTLDAGRTGYSVALLPAIVFAAAVCLVFTSLVLRRRV